MSKYPDYHPENIPGTPGWSHVKKRKTITLKKRKKRRKEIARINRLAGHHLDSGDAETQ